MNGVAMYDPPYESPIEDAFAWCLAKYLRRDSSLHKQVEVSTICGTFRLDFVATSATGKRIAFECDGAEFHDFRRDEWRDAMILGAGGADSIVRMRGIDLTYHLDDVLLLLAKWDPSLFSDRSQATLKRLASDRARAYAHDSTTSAMVTYWESSVTGNNPLHIFLVRRNAFVPMGRREYWQNAFQFAKSMRGDRLDDVLQAWQRSGGGACRIVGQS